MANIKKSSVTTTKNQNQVKPAAEKKTAKMKGSSNTQPKAKSAEELVVENFAALSQVVESLSETLEMLVQKTESMAYHIIANEEMLAELVADNGINLSRVNARIRLKIASGTDGNGNANRAIDAAAAIASPLPRR